MIVKEHDHMTETESSTMRLDVEAERERLAAEAFERIIQSFRVVTE